MGGYVVVGDRIYGPDDELPTPETDSEVPAPETTGRRGRPRKPQG